MSERGCFILIWVLAVGTVGAGVYAWSRGLTAVSVVLVLVAVGLIWLGRPGKKGPSPAADEDMVRTLAALGIPLDFGVGDPKDALIGGVAKAGIYRGHRAIAEGRWQDAIQGLAPVVNMLAGRDAVLAVALRLRAKAHEGAGNRAEAVADYDRVLALNPGDAEAQAGKSRVA